MSMLALGSVLSNYKTFTELEYAIRIGAVSSDKAFLVQKFANNLDIDGAQEDIWANGGTRTENYTGDTLEFVSASANDAAGGTGARTIRAFMIDENYELQQEDITMNGTTAVASTLSNLLTVYRMYVLTAGSLNINDAIITCRTQTGPTTQGTIAAGEGQTEMSHYVVPAGYTFYLIYGQGGIGGIQGAGSQKSGNIGIQVMLESNQIWLSQPKFSCKSGSGPFDFLGGGYYNLPEKSRIKVVGDVETTDSRMFCVYRGVCIANKYLLSNI